MKSNSMKKILPLILALALIVSLCPFSVFADDTDLDVRLIYVDGVTGEDLSGTLEKDDQVVVALVFGKEVEASAFDFKASLDTSKVSVLVNEKKRLISLGTEPEYPAGWGKASVNATKEDSISIGAMLEDAFDTPYTTVGTAIAAFAVKVVADKLTVSELQNAITVDWTNTRVDLTGEKTVSYTLKPVICPNLTVAAKSGVNFTTSDSDDEIKENLNVTYTGKDGKGTAVAAADYELVTPVNYSTGGEGLKLTVNYRGCSAETSVNVTEDLINGLTPATVTKTYKSGDSFTFDGIEVTAIHMSKKTSKVTLQNSMMISAADVDANTANAFTYTSSDDTISVGTPVTNSMAGKVVTVGYVGADHEAVPGTVSYKIMIQGEVSSEPVLAENLVYTGSAQNLISEEGSANLSGASVVYSLSENGTYADANTITGTDAGDYTVWYKVNDDEAKGIAGSKPAKLTARISPKAIDVSDFSFAMTPVEGLVYNGESQVLVTVSDVPEGVVVKYSTSIVSQTPIADATAPSSDIPARTNAGTYTVTYVMGSDPNHYLVKDGTSVEDSDEVKGSVEVTIAKKAVTVKAEDVTVSDSSTAEPATVVEGTDYTVTGLVSGEKLGGSATLKYNYTDNTVSVEIKLPEPSNYVIEKNETGTLTVSGKRNGSSYSGSGGTSSSGTSTRSVTVAETTNGTVKVSTTTPALLANVTFKPEPAQGYKVGTVTVTDSNGNTVAVTPKANGTYSYRQPASNVTIKVTFIPSGESVPSKTKFTDVAAGAYYEDAVVWALNNNVTTGTSDTTFTPNGTVKRCEAVTFLWRAAGMPEPKNANNPFTDVPADEYYYKAVLWAVENGITKGTSETTFSPESTLQRDQLLTFLCRAAGSAEANGDNWSEASVTWANSNKLMEGAEGSFAAKDGCPRRDVVYYMWRYFTQK